MRRFLLACAVLATSLVARAATVDDILDMTKKGEPEGKIIAAVEATPGEFNAGASDVLRMREAKVSDKVILAVLRHTGTAAAAPVSPVTPPVAEKPLPPIQPQVQPNREVAPPPVTDNRPVPVDGRLTIDNLDDRAWS